MSLGHMRTKQQQKVKKRIITNISKNIYQTLPTGIIPIKRVKACSARFSIYMLNSDLNNKRQVPFFPINWIHRFQYKDF